MSGVSTLHHHGSWLSRSIGRFAQEIIWRAGALLYRRRFGLRVHGRDRLPRRGPYLLVSNHVSHLDGPAILAARGAHYRRVFSLGARDYFFRGRLRSWLSTYLLNMVPIDRSRPDFRAVERCRLIAAGRGVILMFPEGTRSRTGELQPFRHGLGLIAERLGIPVVPVYVHGTFAALPKGSRFPRRRTVDVVFGDPIDVQPARAAGRGRPTYRQTAAHVYRSVLELRAELRRSLRGARRDTEWTAPLSQSL